MYKCRFCGRHFELRTPGEADRCHSCKGQRVHNEDGIIDMRQTGSGVWEPDSGSSTPADSPSVDSYSSSSDTSSSGSFDGGGGDSGGGGSSGDF